MTQTAKEQGGIPDFSVLRQRSEIMRQIYAPRRKRPI